MFDFYLAAAAAEAMTFGDQMALGGQVMLLGIGTVFAVLAILWGLVELLHLILSPLSGEKKKKSKEPAPAPVEAAPAPAPVPASAPADNLEIIAVITAAVAAASGSSPSSFRVVSFKRANNRFSSCK